MNSITYINQLKGDFPVQQLAGDSDLADRLIQYLGERLPDVIKHKLNQGTLCAAEIGKYDPQAYISEVAPNDYALIIHSGLSQFIYRVVRVIATRFTSSQFNTTEELPFNDTIRIVAEIFWWLQETGQSFGPEYPILEHQKKMASLIATEVESFFFAHELGHILVPEQSKLTVEKVIEMLTFGDYKGGIADKNNPHLKEYVSDLTAASIVLGIYTNSIDSSFSVKNLRYAGIEIGLMIFSGLEKLGFVISNSHPSFKDRVENIRQAVRKWTNDDEQWHNLIGFAKSFEDLFLSILENIKKPSSDQTNYYDASAKLILLRLDDALNINSLSIDKKPQTIEYVQVDLGNGEVVNMPLPTFEFDNDSITPKYGRFYEQAIGILNKGYLHIVFDEMSKRFRENLKLSYEDLLQLEFRLNTMNYEKSLKFLSENQDLFLQLKEFQKFKLLIGLFSRQGNPSADYFFKKVFPLQL